MLSNSFFENGTSIKRKRRPAGTPDPDAEVVSLSPKTLVESDRYICEICNQGFQREQNLQMHRRRHKVPWKLVKREETPSAVRRKRVFVCPEPSCLHHHPSHALGDLVGIKKHFRRKHSNQRQWICQKCSKGYAVQSDFKAHLKTCGTRGHSCDCGRVFSRVESFIEHQDTCNMGRQSLQSESQSPPQPPASSPSSSIDNNLELQLLTTTTTTTTSSLPKAKLDESSHSSTKLQLSIGSSSESDIAIVMADKAYAEEARRQAKQQIEAAEREFANAKRIRQQAVAEVDKACWALKEQIINSTTIDLHQMITCHACMQQQQQVRAPPPADHEIEKSLSLVLTSYTNMSSSSSAITQRQVVHENPTYHPQFAHHPY
ncbi:Zinc finger protein SHOOT GRAVITROPISM 5 [Camellia lanceoleosa]|uniref:Zinc finger protein SHOOT GRAVITROPISM 5 n=1 Tax=Camellia lanceoleosa TaxID=1840588 RepID=A0ACC0FC99_9ERIC|nr:Zinc finger protein SHOOT GRAVITROPISM 5 [Camellia lanceoleosa]